MNLNYNKAFTIFELTIVLGIIALVFGIILNSNALVQNAQIRSIIADTNLYKNSVKLFEQRYGNLPGDIAANNIWSGANNGDENSRIGTGAGDSADVNAEPTYVWQHLSLAGLVKFSSSGSFQFPPSKIDGSYFILYDANINTPIYNRVGTYLGLSSTYSSLPWGSGLTRNLASAIDNKIDDGLPASGMVYALRGDDMNTGCSGSSCTCVTNYWPATWTNSVNASYIYNDTTKSCRMVFWLKDLN